MAILAAALFLLVFSAVVASEPQCHAPGGGLVAGCPKHFGLALLQTRHTSSKAELATAKVEQTAIQSGDAVLLRVARTGHRVTAQEDGTVHAKWDHAGSWQSFVIEKEVGSGDIQSGDAIFLTAWTGKLVTVGDYQSGDLERTAVHAKWNQKGTWQKLTIEKSGEVGPIMADDEIFLQAWTGAQLDADAPDSAGVVQARWGHQGEWQKLIIEAAAPATTMAPVPTTPNPATTESPAPTTPEPATTTPPQTTTVLVTTAPSTTEEAPAQECVEKQSLGQCQPCLKTEQCATGKYCCPYMKKCVASSSDPCYYPIAQCSPMCYDSMDNSQCTCANTDFPEKWQLPTCGAPATTAPPVPTTPPAGSGEGEEEVPAEVVSSKAWEHFQLLNQLRAEGFTCPNGAAFEPNPVALKFDCRLWRAARLHSEDMAEQNYFSHTSKDGRSPWQRAEEQGTDAHGENIAAGSSTAAGALDQFKNSDGHCRNMMSKDFKIAGMGYGAGGSYRHYWTQMFSLSDSDLADLDTTCYPSDMALLQRDTDGAAEAHQLVLAEPWSRLPA